MESNVKAQKYKVSKFDDIFDYREKLDDDLVMPILTEDLVKIDFSKNQFNTSIEDSSDFLRHLYSGKDVILNEKWTISETFQGKIIHLNEEEVFVDCLVDLDNKIFEHRVFSKYLFQNIVNITPNKPVLIKTRLKPGAIRIDVYPGDGIVNMDLFELNENWDDLKDSGLDDKLSEW